MPDVRAVPKSTFYNWLREKNKLGGQHKIPRLSNERSFVEELLVQVERSVFSSGLVCSIGYVFFFLVAF